MTSIVLTVGMAAAGLFCLGLLAGMGAGVLILRRADGLGARKDRVSRVARRLVG